MLISAVIYLYSNGKIPVGNGTVVSGDKENNTVSDLIMEMFDNKIKFNTAIKTGTTSPTNLKIVIVDAVRNK